MPGKTTRGRRKPNCSGSVSRLSHATASRRTGGPTAAITTFDHGDSVPNQAFVIGANATIVCGVTVGRYAFIGAGSVVTRDVADYALVMGVPAVKAGWMSRHGHRLRTPGPDGLFTCPESGLRYREDGGRLLCLDLPEERGLPGGRAEGHLRYRDLRGTERG